MGNCQTKSATAVADRRQGSSAPCRSDSYDSSDASSVDDARLMVSKASDEEFDGVQEDEDRAIRANLRPLDAVQLVESFTANEFEASATNGIEIGLRMVSDGRTDDAKDESKPTVETAKLTVVTAADPSAVESTKPPKSTSRTTRSNCSNRSTRTSSSRHRHQSKRRGSRRAASPGLPKASTTSSVADRSHLLNELDGLVASFSMSMAGTSNEEEGSSDSGDELDGLAETVVIGVVPLPGEEPTAKAAPGTVDNKTSVPETHTNVAADAIGAIVPFDTNFSDFDNSQALVLDATSGRKVCAYEVTEDDIDAVSKNNNMMVVHEPNSTGGAETNPFGNYFAFQDEKKDEDVGDDRHNTAIVPSTGAPPLLTPPNDANKSMPSELYLSPESGEEDEDDRLFTEGLPLLMAEGAQVEATTELVPYSSNTTKASEELIAEENPHAIVEFAGRNIVPADYHFSDPPPPVTAKASLSPQSRLTEPQESVSGVEIEDHQLCGPVSHPKTVNDVVGDDDDNEMEVVDGTAKDGDEDVITETDAKVAADEEAERGEDVAPPADFAILSSHLMELSDLQARLEEATGEGRLRRYLATAHNEDDEAHAKSGISIEEGSNAINSTEVQRTDVPTKENSKETISDSVAATSAPSSALLPSSVQSVASMSRLSQRAKHYRAARIDPKKSVKNTGTDDKVVVDKTKDAVEEEVSIVETKSIDLSIVECNSGETEVSEITSNQVYLDEVPVTSRASHRARQLRSRSTVRRGRAMSVESRGSVASDDKATKDAGSGSNARSKLMPVKNALPPVPKVTSSVASVLSSDGENTTNRPSATASSCRLARTRRSRSQSVRRRAAQPQENKTAGAKKEEEAGSEMKANLPLQNSSSIDHKAAEDLETEESKEMHVEENMNKASDANDGGAKEINVEDKNPAEIEKASACRPRSRSQRRAMATRSGKKSCPRAILGEKDTVSAGSNRDWETSTKGRELPARDVAADRSTKSLNERKDGPSRSVDTSSSIDEAQSVSNSSAENGENDVLLVAASADSKVENNIQERKEKARRRAERARRLRALQN